MSDVYPGGGVGPGGGKSDWAHPSNHRFLFLIYYIVFLLDDKIDPTASFSSASCEQSSSHGEISIRRPDPLQTLFDEGRPVGSVRPTEGPSRLAT